MVQDIPSPKAGAILGSKVCDRICGKSEDGENGTSRDDLGKICENRDSEKPSGSSNDDNDNDDKPYGEDFPDITGADMKLKDGYDDSNKIKKRRFVVAVAIVLFVIIMCATYFVWATLMGYMASSDNEQRSEL